jgi:hypothetical protein
VTGALLGAAAGGIIGNQSRRGLEGAAIGGLLGAFAGGAIQNSRERQYQQPHHGRGYGYDYGQPHYQQGCAPQAFGQPSGYDPYGFGNWH